MNTDILKPQSGELSLADAMNAANNCWNITINNIKSLH